jgi:RsiW-degrading membrane proteinase PrsW (M82 family)
MGIGLTIILLSLLAAVIYSLTIYLTVPYKTIDLKQSIVFLCVGFMSVSVLKYIWFIYPEWHTIAERFTGNPNMNPLKYYHYYYFVQVGFIEEVSKLIIFVLFEKYRRNHYEVKDHPISTMFYVAMVSLGFAVIENIQYASGSYNPMEVLWWRSITAVIAHMVFGLFMGYWIAIGRMGPSFEDRSLMDLVINKKKKLRNIFYTIVGLGAATILHGMYDLHIELNGSNGITGLYTLLMVSLLGAYWCFNNLNKLYKRKVKYLNKKACNL